MVTNVVMPLRNLAVEIGRTLSSLAFPTPLENFGVQFLRLPQETGVPRHKLRETQDLNFQALIAVFHVQRVLKKCKWSR
jgi:hypothetical protein